jgi:hypothetical protein
MFGIARLSSAAEELAHHVLMSVVPGETGEA